MLPPDLQTGYARFRAGPYAAQRARFDALAHGQSPATMVISCADSRVDPAQIFDAAPGELFVIRNVANLVPPYERGGGQHGVSSAIEFAVLGLKVKQILVMGHAACGGVSAALHGHNLVPEGESFLSKWISLLDPARALIAGATDPQRALELESVRVSLTNLRSFPFVAEAERAGRLTLHGSHFGIAEGELREVTEQAA